MNLIPYILLIIFFLPVVIREYQKDKELFKIAKIFNLFFSSVILYFFISIVKPDIVNILSNYETVLSNEFVEYGILTPLLSVISWFLYIIIYSIISVLLVLIILRRNKFRRNLLYIIPVFFVINSIQFYKFGIVKDDELTHSVYFLPSILIPNVIICLVILFFYSNKYIKRIFY